MIPFCYLLSPYHHFPSLFEIKRNPLWDLLIIFSAGQSLVMNCFLLIEQLSFFLSTPHIFVYLISLFSLSPSSWPHSRQLMWPCHVKGLCYFLPCVFRSCSPLLLSLRRPWNSNCFPKLTRAKKKHRTEVRAAPRICVRVVHHAPCHVRHAKAWQLANVLSLAWKGFVNGACCKIRTWPERATRWSRFVRGGGGLGRIAAIVVGTERRAVMRFNSKGIAHTL